MNNYRDQKVFSEICEHRKGYDEMYRTRNAINRKASIGKLGYTLFEYKYIYIRKMKKIKKIISKINKKLKILEAGCGTGDSIPYLIDYTKSYYGTDVSDFQIECARKNTKRYKNVFLSITSMEYLPFKNSLFDIVLAFDVFEHLVDPEISLLEASRVTKKGGWIIITTPLTNKETPIRTTSFKEYKLNGKSFYLREHYIDQERFINMFKKAGYTIIMRNQYGRFFVGRYIIRRMPSYIQKSTGVIYGLLDDIIEILIGRFIKCQFGYQLIVARKDLNH